MIRKEQITIFGSDYEISPMAMFVVGVMAAPLILFTVGVTFIATLLSCSGGRRD